MNYSAKNALKKIMFLCSLFILIYACVEGQALSIEERFEIKIEEDCSRFREGVFLSKSNISEGEREITRLEGFQISDRVDGKKKQKYKLEWLSNNRYQLFYIDDNEKIHYDKEIQANIYEVKGDTYKYIGKALLGNGKYLYMEGEGIIKK